MRIAPLMLLLVACDDYLLPAPEGDEVTERIADVLELTGDAEAGADVYAAEDCVPCHGPTGTEAPIGPDLSEWVAVQEPSGTIELLITGRNAMPSYDKLSDQELADLTAWMHDTL